MLFHKKSFLKEIKKLGTILLEPAVPVSNDETKKKLMMDNDNEKLAVSRLKLLEGFRGNDDRKTDNEIPIKPKGTIMEITESSKRVFSKTQTHILESSN